MSNCQLVLIGAILIVSASLGHSGSADDSKINNNQPIDNRALLSKTITVPTNGASIDDYLLELAQNADVNLIADATEFPVDSPVTPYPANPATVEGLRGPQADKWKPTLQNLIYDLAAEQKLTHLPYAERTFLFWNEPDIVEIARLIWAEQKDQPIEMPPSHRTLRALLTDYFMQSHGWDGQSTNVNIKVKISDLPPAIRADVIAEVRAELLDTVESRKASPILSTNSTPSTSAASTNSTRPANSPRSSNTPTRQPKVEPKGEPKVGDQPEPEVIVLKPSPGVWFNPDFWKRVQFKIGVESETNPDRWVPYLFMGGVIDEPSAREKVDGERAGEPGAGQPAQRWTFIAIGRLDWLQR